MLQYVRYRRKALTRHGVHSPFVFDLIEHGLRPKDGRSLQEKLVNYFSENEITWIDMPDPLQWNRLFEKHTREIQYEGVIIVKGIHDSAPHLQAWDTLKRKAAVRLSIDLFEYGLLFFRDAFKEKQHFVIKYPV